MTNADCKCRRLGDYWNGSHHPLCDANWTDAEGASEGQSDPIYQVRAGRFWADVALSQWEYFEPQSRRVVYAASRPATHSRDAIERSKPILEAVDTYLRRPDRMNRNALRGMIFDEFEELLAAMKEPK